MGPSPTFVQCPSPYDLPSQQLQLGPCEPRFPGGHRGVRGITMETSSLGLPGGVWAPPHKSAPEPWGRLGWGGRPSGPQFAMGTEVPESLPLPGVEADKGLMGPSMAK